MKNFFKTSAVMLLSLFVFSCSEKEADQVKPIAKLDNSNARQYPSNCGPGTVWHPVLQMCVPANNAPYEPKPTDAIWDNARTQFNAYDNSSARVRQRSATINGVTFFEEVIYKDGLPTNSKIYLRLTDLGSNRTATQFYDETGKTFAIMETERIANPMNPNELRHRFKSVAWKFGVGGTPEFETAFGGNFSRCVGRAISQLAQIPLAGLGCIAFGPECATAIGIGCAISSAVVNH